MYDTGLVQSQPSPAEVPGATNSVVRLPSSQQLRLASGPAQPATRLISKPHPSLPCFRLAGLSLSSAETGPHPAWAQLASSPPQSACWPGLSDVSETGLRPSPAIAQPPQCGCPARRKLASGPAQPTTHASKDQPSCPRLSEQDGFRTSN